MEERVALVALGMATLVACAPQVIDAGWDNHETGQVYPGNGGNGGAAGVGATGGAAGSETSAPCEPESSLPCYDGPPGTEGVGVCKGGTKTCEADGTGFGACLGQVTPKVEDCTTAADEDCDGLTPACPVASTWSKHFGDTSAQEGTAVTVDGAGNVLLTGYFFGSADFGGGPLQSAGGNIFIAKLDPSGSHLWSKRFGDANINQRGQGIVADSAGNVLVTGSFGGSVDFGGGPLQSAGNTDIFLAKLDGNGAHQWSKRFGDSDFQFGASVAADGSGNVLLTGHFSGLVDFGGAPLQSAGNADVFLAKLDASGNHLWSKHFGDSHFQQGNGVAADSAGNVLLTGYFSGSVDFGSGPLQSAGNYDVFLAKFDTSGHHLWSKRFGDSDSQEGYGIAVDDGGAVFITGSFAGSADFGGGPLQSAGNHDVFLAKFDATGNHLWSKRFGDTNIQQGSSVATDAAGNVIVTGSLAGTTDFGGGALQSAGGDDVFLAKFDSNGGHLWSRRFGDTSAQRGNSVAVDSAGSLLVTGYFFGSADFGGGSLQSAGSTDIFLAKLAP